MSVWWLHRRLRSQTLPIAAVLTFALSPATPHALGAASPPGQQRTGAASQPAKSTKKPAAAPAPAKAKATTAIDAALARITAFVSHDQFKEAFDEYDAFRKTAGPANSAGAAALLAPIARGRLRALSHGELTSAQSEALGALAADGDRAARRRLEEMATSEKATSAAAVSANEALARLGDARAAERLVAFAEQVDPGRRSILLAEIATVPHAPALSLVRESLKSTDPMAQATAADAAAALGLKELQPELRQVLATGHPFARNGAAVALMRFGDTASKDRVRTLLTSPAASVRLQAARAFDASGDRSWVPDVQSLLKDPEGLTRFLAAELLLPIDRAASLDVLRAGIVDENPTIRAECARILTADRHPDLDTLRLLLADATPRVQLLASKAVLEQARTPATSPSPPRAARPR